MKPKKQHSGFIVMYSTEREYRYKRGRKSKSVWLWETKLQTPYSVEFTDEQARKLIAEEMLQRKKGQASLIGQLGIQEYYPYKYEDLMEEPDITERIDSQNIMLEVKLRANFNTGYWEIQVFHTEALGQVPKKMKK